jgi:CO/xanthine dehydrogenase FAD-binding subunit
MRTAITPLSVRRPRTLAEALAMLRDDGPLVPLAGATDLYVSLNFGTLSATKFVDLWSLDPLRRIVLRGDVLSIGALATYTGLTRSRLVRQRVPILAEAARQIGGVQIQNRGTIGGATPCPSSQRSRR